MTLDVRKYLTTYEPDLGGTAPKAGQRVWAEISERKPVGNRGATWASEQRYVAFCMAGCQLNRLRNGFDLYAAGRPYKCPYVAQHARDNGDFLPLSQMQVGDWLMFGPAGAEYHVETITGFNADKSQITTIGYNTSSGSRGSQAAGGGVWRRTRYPKYTKFSGVVRHTNFSQPEGDGAKFDTLRATPVKSRGEHVRKVQKFLLSYDWSKDIKDFVKYGADAVYGNGSAEAVAVYQARMNRWFARKGIQTSLVVDGIWGPATEAAAIKYSGLKI